MRQEKFSFAFIFYQWKENNTKTILTGSREEKENHLFLCFLESTLKHSCELHSVSAWNLPGNSSNITGEVIEAETEHRAIHNYWTDTF